MQTSVAPTVRVVMNAQRQWEVSGIALDGGVYGTAAFHQSKARQAWTYLNELAASSGAEIDTDGSDSAILNLMSDVAQAFTERGFSLTDTGGGIEQWLYVHEPSGGHRIITTQDGEQPDSMEQAVMVGYYNDAGELYETLNYDSLTATLDNEERPWIGDPRDDKLTDDDERSFGPR